MGLLILAVTALIAGVVVWAQFNHTGPMTAPIPPTGSKTAARSSSIKPIPKRKSFRETLESAKETPAGKPKKPNAYMIPALIEDSDHGPLPKRATDGRSPRSAYAASFRATDKNPRIAIILTGLGMRKAVDELALRSLPPMITFAFSPYGSDLLARSRKAREAGHEILMLLPMEARQPKLIDRGTSALRIADDAAVRMTGLYKIMSRFGGYVGLLGTRGEALSSGKDGATEIFSEIGRRGLIYLAPAASPPIAAGKAGTKVPTTKKEESPGKLATTRNIVHLWLDRELTRQGVDQAMKRAEAMAKRDSKHLVVAVQAYPMTINAIRRWAARLPDKGITPAPLTAVISISAQTAKK